MNGQHKERCLVLVPTKWTQTIIIFVNVCRKQELEHLIVAQVKRREERGMFTVNSLIGWSTGN